MNKNRHLIISGPCSAESREQVLQTAIGLKETGKVDIYRAGLWKPRTRPGTFTGVGEVGISWLQEVTKTTGMKVCTEIALPEHAEKCMKAGINIFWIGARTVSNPFSVQELAECLKGTDSHVYIKNPVNPDLSLWIGGVERFLSCGLENTSAIHRGFYPFEKSSVRNIPKWEVVIEFKSNFPGIKVICDVSHIAGKKEYLYDIAQKALDLNMDGLMIECHINPQSALSDAKQQVTPVGFSDLINSLVFRESISDSIEFRNKLEDLRARVDSIDSQIIELLAARMKLTEKIGTYKKSHNIAILQVKRWNEILGTRLTLAGRNGLSKRFTRAFLNLIHGESINRQTVVFNREKNKKSRNAEAKRD